jgi:hypothetical protein
MNHLTESETKQTHFIFYSDHPTVEWLATLVEWLATLVEWLATLVEWLATVGGPD